MLTLNIISGFSDIDQDNNRRVASHKKYYDQCLSAISELGVKPTILTIDPLAIDWFSELEKNHFRSGCAPIQALHRAQELLNQGHEAIIISGFDPLKTGYDRDQRHQLMSIYDPETSIADLYNQLAQQFIGQHHTNDQQFLTLASALFENYSQSHTLAHQQQRAHFSPPAAKWFNHVTELFRGVDCANPLVDFNGRLLLCSTNLVERLNLKPSTVVNVAGIGLGLLDIDEPKQLALIAQYQHLQAAYQAACQQAAVNFKQLVSDNNALMEVYTCYPVVPLAFLINTGMVTSLSQIPEFLNQHLITVTGGMNLARAPWNTPALNGIITMYHQLMDSPQQFGLVHGNGGIGYRHGIAILATE